MKNKKGDVGKVHVWIDKDEYSHSKRARLFKIIISCMTSFYMKLCFDW